MKNRMMKYSLFFAVLLAVWSARGAQQQIKTRSYSTSEHSTDSPNRLIYSPYDFTNSLCTGLTNTAHIDTIRIFRKAYRQALLRQNTAQALAYCDSLIRYSRKIGVQNLLFLDAYRKRAELLYSMQRDSEACLAYIRAIREQDTLMRYTESDAVRDMQATYELDRLALGQALLQARHHKAALVSMIVLLAVVLCAVAFFYSSNRKTKRLQQELLRSIERSRASEEQKSTFINSMCHETRTPLNCITGFSELLCSGEITPDLHDQYYEIIQQSRSQLRYAFNDMLDVAYLENLTGSLPRNDSNLAALCRNQLHLLGVKHPKAGVELVSEIPDGEIDICSNEKYLSVLIFELLGNALKFTDSGSICIACSIVGADKVKISVTDTGCGIPAEQRERAFERFTKLDPYRQGNGLGLYLCSLIVRNLGGEIAIDPEYTAGTRMVVILPRA